MKFLTALENYANFTYELPKVSHAAIPDFNAGAMENWGLITYKEQYLIGDENSHHFDALEILLTTAHELSHFAFGDLVTCKWWNQIWLNEGFATLFEYLLVNIVHPDMRVKEYFTVNKLQYTLKLDAFQSIHPMSFDGDTVYEIEYYKGESLWEAKAYLYKLIKLLNTV